MFGRRSDEDRARGREFMEASSRVIALLSEHNGRFQEALDEGWSLPEAAKLQYYLHRVAFIEHAYLCDQLSREGQLPKFCISDFKAYSALVDAAVFFSRLRYLAVTDDATFSVTPSDLALWKTRIEQAWTASDKRHMSTLKGVGVAPAEWLATLHELESTIRTEVVPVESAHAEAALAETLWRAAFTWSLAITQEAGGTDELADRLFSMAVAAACHAMEMRLDPAESDDARLRYDVVSAVMAEESFQRFHDGIMSGQIRDISQIPGFIARFAVDQTGGWYQRYSQSRRCRNLRTSSHNPCRNCSVMT